MRFPDDFIFDDFSGAGNEGLLEAECMGVIERQFRHVSMFVGEKYVLGLAKEIAVDQLMHGYGLSEERAQSDVDGSADILNVMDRWTDTASYSLPLQRNALNLQMYAMIGWVDVNANSYRELRDHVGKVVTWAEQLLEEVLDESKEKYLCLFSRAARARWDLDLGHNPRFEDFAALASLARHPHAEPVGDAVLDLPTKTLQNLLASKTLKRAGADRLEHKGAHLWMSKQWSHDILYPSLAMRSAQDEPAIAKVVDPVFVPIISETAYVVSEPFLPEHKYEHEYCIETTGGECRTDDYWKAIDILKRASAPRIKVQEHAHSLAVGQVWKLIERSVLEQMIENEKSVENDPVIGLSARTAQFIDAHPNISVHRKGHAKKMFRYICSNGQEIAVEKRPGRPLIYVVSSEKNRELLSGFVIRTKGRGPKGRHGNLNTMDGFVNNELIVLRPESLDEAKRLIELVAESADIRN